MNESWMLPLYGNCSLDVDIDMLQPWLNGWWTDQIFLFETRS